MSAEVDPVCENWGLEPCPVLNDYVEYVVQNDQNDALNPSDQNHPFITFWNRLCVNPVAVVAVLYHHLHILCQLVLAVSIIMAFSSNPVSDTNQCLFTINYYPLR